MNVNFNQMPTVPNDLAAMNDRMQQWMSEKPAGFNNELEYRPLVGDLVVFHFVASGNDGARFLSTYKSHSYDAISKNGKRFNQNRYCPISSGDTEHQCSLCQSGDASVLKERMSWWMYIYSILHSVMPKDKAYPVVNFEGRNYYQEEVNGFKAFHTSAWRESPWNDIVKFAGMYGGLNNFMAQLATTGEGLARRYKVYPMPNTAGIDPTIYERALTECEPIIDMLRKQLASPVQVAPAQAGQQTQAQPTLGAAPFTPPGTQTPGFTIPGAPSVIPASVPTPMFGVTREPLSQATAGAPNPLQLSGHEVEPPTQEQHPFDVDEDNKRPMKGMF